MNSRELVELLPHFVSHAEGLSDFRTVLPPAPDQVWGGVYACQDRSAVVTFMVNGEAALRITAGVATDLDMRTDVGAHVNTLNTKVLMVGRLFYREAGDGARGAVLLQEIVECEHFDSGPSVNAVLMVIMRVAAMAGRLSPEFSERHGGRPWSADEALLVSGLG